MSAYAEIPPVRWLMPDPDVRRCRFPAYARIWIDHAMRTGTIDVAATPDNRPVGAALWWPEPGTEPCAKPSTEPAAKPADYTRRLAEAVGHEHLPRFEAFDAVTRMARPRDEHLYLGFVAVAPAYQGRGYGTALLRRRCADLDAAGAIAYLVAASPAARRLCPRHGFRDRGQQVTPLDGPRLQPMWRDPAVD